MKSNLHRSKKAFFLGIFLAVCAFAAAAEEAGSHFSNRNILADLNPGKTPDVFYSFDGFATAGIPYNGPVLLDALNGEERRYEISVRTEAGERKEIYIIDKRLPKEPVFRQVYSSDGNLSLKIEGGQGGRIFAGQEGEKSGPVQWLGGELRLSGNSSFAYAYSEDNAGNRSRTVLYRKEPVFQSSLPAGLKIISPVSGFFANTQLLYIENEGFEWIKYSLNGQDPVVSGADYKQPVEIRRYGNIRLRVAAKPLYSDTVITRELDYQVNTRSQLKNIPGSGVYSDMLGIEGGFTNHIYCLEDRSPEKGDPVFGNSLQIYPISGGIKYSILRIKPEDKPESAEYRYLYIFDDRYPAEPVINTDGNLPFSGKTTVVLSGPAYSSIYYTLDGSTPGEDSYLYDGPFEVTGPPDREAGSVIIKARAFYLSGKASNVTTRLLPFDSKPPEIPEVKMVKDESGAYIPEYNAVKGEKLLYSLSLNGGDFSPLQPAESDTFRLDVPVGMKAVFKLLFAASDSAGNISELSEAVELELDRRPPAQPETEYRNGRLAVRSTAEITSYDYRIERNGEVIDKGSGIYEGPLELKEIDGISELIVDARAEDSSGNVTAVRKHFMIGEAGGALPPVIRGNGNTGVYNSETKEFNIKPAGLDQVLIYYLTVTDESGEAVKYGPYETDGIISVSGEPGRELSYRLDVVSKAADGSSSGFSSREFVLDLRPPEIPVVSGPENGRVYGSRIVLSAEAEENSVVFIHISEDPGEDLDPFSGNGMILEGNLVFDSPQGETRTWYLRAGAEDPAGNRSVSDRIISFTVDRERPEGVLPDGIPENGCSSKPVMLENNTGMKMRYEIAADANLPPVPGYGSPLLESLELAGKAGTEKNYLISVRTEDAAGNLSLYPETFSVKIDRKAPEIPEPPKRSVYSNGNVNYIWIENSSDHGIFYRKAGSAEAFQKYEGPFSLKYSGTRAELEYCSIDCAGNRSMAAVDTAMIPVLSDEKLVEGAEAGNAYRDDVVISKRSSSTVRYEVSSDGTFPEEADIFSPVMPDKLVFRAAEGEQMSYLIRFREFASEKDPAGGQEQIVSFTLDRKKPSAPVINGITDGEYYLENRTVGFNSITEDIYYCVCDGTGETGNQQEYKLYDGKFELEAGTGEYRAYTVKAYSSDAAGNRSREAEWSVAIDKQLVYVSTDGNDYFNGTRTKPYKSLEKALEQARKTGRRSVVMSSGEHLLKQPVVINDSITIIGGYSGSDWSERSGITMIKPSEDYPESNPMFYIYGGSLSIRNISINLEQDKADSVFYVNKGDLNIDKSVISVYGESAAAISQNYGSAAVTSSEINGSVFNGALVKCSNGDLRIANTSVKGLEKSGILVKVEGSRNFTLTGSELRTGAGRNTEGIRIEDSLASIRNSRIYSARTDISSVMINLVNSRAEIQYCRLESDRDSRLVTAVNSEDSEVRISGSTVRTFGETGSVGFNLTGGECEMTLNTVNVSSSNGFVYAVRVKGARLKAEVNNFETDAKSVYSAVRLESGKTGFYNNTLRISGSSAASGVFIEAGASADIINNLLITAPGAGRTAFLVKKPDEAVIKNNCLCGWDLLLDGAKKADGLQELELSDGVYFGGRISGNLTAEEADTVNGNMRLKSGSVCIDRGLDLSVVTSTARDIDGDPRPAPGSPFDIGSDEYYEP